MAKFNVGDKVRVTYLDLLDEVMGINEGDIFEVVENDNVPYCKPITLIPSLEEEMNDGLWALDEDQLELLGEWVEC